MIILRHQSKRELLIRSEGFLILLVSMRTKKIPSARYDASEFTWSLSRVLRFVPMFSISFLTVLHQGHDVNHLCVYTMVRLRCILILYSENVEYWLYFSYLCISTIVLH